MYRLKPFFPFILVIFVFITRIPLITGSYFQVDGDEAVVGLMANDIAEDGHFKVYFWGQTYGFTTFEASCAAITYKVFGMNPWSLKLTMLFLWALGCVLLYETVKNLLGFQTAVLFTIVLILMPSWGLWSMKARGGYMTAFLFSAACAWMLERIYTQKDKKQLHYWLFLGISLAVIFLSQKLWLISLAPFLGVVIINGSSKKLPLTLLLKEKGGVEVVKKRVFGTTLKRFGALKLCLLTCIAFFTWWYITWLGRNEVGNYWFEAKVLHIYFWENIDNALPWIQQHLSGAYFLNRDFFAGGSDAFIAQIWLIIFLILMGLQIMRIITRKFLPISHLLAIATIGSSIILFTSIYGVFQYRYILPMDVPLVLWLIVEGLYWIKKYHFNRIVLPVFLIFIVINYVGLYQLRRISIEDRHQKPTLSYQSAMDSAIHFLKQRQIYATFSPNPMVEWQVPFYSKKTVYCRRFDGKDRLWDYIRPVTKAFNTGKPTAMIDTYGSENMAPEKIGTDASRIINIGNQLCIYLYPTRQQLDKLGYDMHTY